eukprot:993529-Prorocentrum_minimum.AAC.1
MNAVWAIERRLVKAATRAAPNMARAWYMYADHWYHRVHACTGEGDDRAGGDDSLRHQCEQAVL